MKKQYFTNQYVCPGDIHTQEINGIIYQTKIMYDQDYHIDNDDVHNIDQNITGCNNEQQEKLIAARNAWLNGEWFYCGVLTTAFKAGIEIDGISLWGIETNYPESDNSYIDDVITEQIEELQSTIQDKIEKMIQDLKS